MITIQLTIQEAPRGLRFGLGLRADPRPSSTETRAARILYTFIHPFARHVARDFNARFTDLPAK